MIEQLEHLLRARVLRIFDILKLMHEQIAHVRYVNILTAAVLAQSIERVDCRAGDGGFDSRGRTNTRGLKITEK